MTKKLRFREALGPAKAAQLSERDSKQLKHLLGPQRPAETRRRAERPEAAQGCWWGRCVAGSHALPRGPSPQRPLARLGPGRLSSRAAAQRRRGRGRSSGAGRESGRGRRTGPGKRALLQHGTPAANPGALLRCAVPLLLVGLRGDSGSPLGWGLEGKGGGDGEAGRGDRDLVKFLALPARGESHFVSLNGIWSLAPDRPFIA